MRDHDAMIGRRSGRVGLWLNFGGELIEVEQATPADFGPLHDEQLLAATLTGRTLAFPHPDWRSQFLGRGEEKAVFCVCDHNRHAFALELIDERTYLNGGYVAGAYFLQRRIPGLSGVEFDPAAGRFGLTFTGLVKVREYAYGYEWSRFQWRPDRQRRVDRLMTAALRLLLQNRYDSYRRRYRDVHERNVLFEVRAWRASGVPVLVRDWTGRLRLAKVGLAPIDLRP